MVMPDTDLMWGAQREWERENSIARVGVVVIVEVTCL